MNLEESVKLFFMMSERSIIEILTSAIAPVTLITGVAFLTSIMAPRFGRCIDRIRTILIKLESSVVTGAQRENHLNQLEILYRRTTILRNTMISAGICILFVVLTIAATFSHLLVGFPGPRIIVTIFFFALASLVILTIGFIYDFLQSLNAVKIEIEFALGEQESLFTKNLSTKI